MQEVIQKGEGRNMDNEGDMRKRKEKAEGVEGIGRGEGGVRGEHSGKNGLLKVKGEDQGERRC